MLLHFQIRNNKETEIREEMVINTTWSMQIIQLSSCLFQFRKNLNLQTKPRPNQTNWTLNPVLNGVCVVTGPLPASPDPVCWVWTSSSYHCRVITWAVHWHLKGFMVDQYFIPVLDSICLGLRSLPSGPHLSVLLGLSAGSSQTGRRLYISFYFSLNSEL